MRCKLQESYKSRIEMLSLQRVVVNVVLAVPVDELAEEAVTWIVVQTLKYVVFLRLRGSTRKADIIDLPRCGFPGHD